MPSTDKLKEERFKKFKSRWESTHPAASSSCSCASDVPNKTGSFLPPDCCAKGWDHLHVVMQTLVVTGGFLLMTLYKAIWHKYNRKITHLEEAGVTFFSSFFLIYLVFLCFNRKYAMTKIR